MRLRDCALAGLNFFLDGEDGRKEVPTRAAAPDDIIVPDGPVCGLPFARRDIVVSLIAGCARRHIS
jgi:hypothetical protein